MEIIDFTAIGNNIVVVIVIAAIHMVAINIFAMNISGIGISIIDIIVITQPKKRDAVDINDSAQVPILQLKSPVPRHPFLLSTFTVLSTTDTDRDRIFVHSPLRLGWLAANRCPGTGTATRLATTNRLFRSECSDSPCSDRVLQSLRVRVTFRGGHLQGSTGS